MRAHRIACMLAICTEMLVPHKRRVCEDDRSARAFVLMDGVLHHDVVHARKGLKQVNVPRRQEHKHARLHVRCCARVVHVPNLERAGSRWDS